MEIAIITLLCIAILLFLISFTKTDSLTHVEKLIDKLSLQHVQDVYQLKKRIRLLEEELVNMDTSKKGVHVNEILKNQVLALSQQGISIADISKRSTLSEQDIIVILKDTQMEGL